MTRRPWGSTLHAAGVHTSPAPTLFDPAETPGLITPFTLPYNEYSASYEDLRLKKK